MCENDAIDAFMSFDFAGVAKEVEAALAFKARNAEPDSRPPYAHILYAWHIQRGNYRDSKFLFFIRQAPPLQTHRCPYHVPASTKVVGVHY